MSNAVNSQLMAAARVILGGGGGSEKDILPSEFRGTEAYFLLNTLSPTKLNNVMTSRL